MLSWVFGRSAPSPSAVGPISAPADMWVTPGPADQPLQVCSRPGCRTAATIRCRYVDPVGEACGWWCERHGTQLEGVLFCERHANTVRHQRARLGSIYEIKFRARRDDRRANLVSLVVDELDTEVREVLSRRFAGSGAQIITDPAVRQSHRQRQAIVTSDAGLNLVESGRAVAWTRGWSACTPQGYLCRVSLEAADGEPPLVSLAVDGRVIARSVPDWLPARGSGGRGVGFRTELLSALRGALFPA